MPDDLHRVHPPVEGPAAGAQAATPLGGHSSERGTKHGLRAGTGAVGDDSRGTRPDRATRFVETALGVLSYSELAPLLGERVTRLEAAVQAEEFARRPLDENLLAEFHSRICGDLTPEWAGKWRTVEVAVGPLNPPAPHQLPMLMRDYGLDLQARWQDASGESIDLALEFLAFAEGRFLSIHPFQDFNGRTIRVFLAELLRRLDFPLVSLAPESDAGRARYFAALDAADRRDWQPLITLWQRRFTEVPFVIPMRELTLHSSIKAFGSSDSNAVGVGLLSSAMGLARDETPFHWQQKLLVEFLAGQIPRALDIPTGLGKTAVMAIWLVARIRGASVPRRLVYVVDRRAVVDQATAVAVALREFVETRPEIKTDLGISDGLSISTLRGQHVDNRQWLESPASPAIIVGTVDMIGSRLLFEGYGVSRKMRPYHAGLLGTDTVIVLDEAHLVPPFEKLLKRIAQSEGELQPRDAEHRKLVPTMKLLSLSATGRSDQPAFGLSEDDLKPGTITHKRLTAAKHLVFEPLPAEEEIAEALARSAWSLTANGAEAVKVIVFSDKREVAVKAKQAVEKLAKGDRKQEIPPVQIDTQLLVGGRRVHEREGTARWLEEHLFVAGAKARPPRTTFVFATSAGEVGIDLDADHMVSDLVSWERMVQRLGRVNRRGDGSAKIFVIREPDPKPNKAEENALKKPERERETKERKAIAAYQAKVDKARALTKPFDLLPRSERGIDVSPASLRDLKLATLPNPNDEEDNRHRAARRAILDSATSDTPLRPALSRPFVDAWAMTSLPQHTGRPKIQPWLRGWVDDEPQTTVIWRRYLPFEPGSAETSPKTLRDFFEAAPPHTSEMLETETWQVMAWLKKRAEAIQKSHASTKKAAADPASAPLSLDEPFAIILDRDGGPSGLPITVTALLASLGDKKAKDALERRLTDSTIVVDARFAGLSEDGLLDESEETEPQTLDGSEDWLPPIKGEPAIRFRVRTADQIAPATERGWRHRLRVPIERSVEGEVLQWLVVEKWRNDSTTADDGASGALQTLTDHQEAAVLRVQAICHRLSLPQPYARMLEIAARLHDEGKRVEKWQKAFNAPAVGGPFAKTPGPINQVLLDGYRHEFSSLPMLAADPEFLALPSDELRDLALHLVAAHHGFARPLIGVQGCADAPPSLLEERSREVALRFVRLQRRWGPWGLAWWESLLRAADQQASRHLELACETPTPHSTNG